MPRAAAPATGQSLPGRSRRWSPPASHRLPAGQRKRLAISIYADGEGAAGRSQEPALAFSGTGKAVPGSGHLAVAALSPARGRRRRGALHPAPASVGKFFVAVRSRRTVSRSARSAEMLCFADGSTFSRAFRREFGMSPSDVRARASSGMPPNAPSRNVLRQGPEVSASAAPSLTAGPGGPVSSHGSAVTPLLGRTEPVPGLGANQSPLH